MKIRINIKKLIIFQFLYVIAIRFLISNFGAPSYLSYGTDLINLVLLFAIIVKPQLYENTKRIKCFAIWGLLFVLTTVFGLLYNNQKVTLFIWGYRNSLRYFIYFIACVLFLDQTDVGRIVKMVKYLYGLNFIVALIQYFALGYKQDQLGGIFGNANGVNGYLNILLIIGLTIYAVEYLDKKIRLSTFIVVIFSGLFIASLGELKFLFIEVVLIVVMAILYTRVNFRSISIIVISTAGIALGVFALYTIFPNWSNFFSLDKIMETSTYYATQTDLGRMNALTRSYDKFFSNDQIQFLFGKGMGSAETSQISMFNSSFYDMYANQLHYNWLTQAMIFIEQGLVGLVMNISFYILVYWNNCKRYMTNMNRVGKILAVLSVLLIFYNSSMRTEAAYMIYLFLGCSLVYYGDWRREA